MLYIWFCILLIKTTAAQNEVALSYYRVRGLYFLAVVFVTTIVTLIEVQLWFTLQWWLDIDARINAY